MLQSGNDGQAQAAGVGGGPAEPGAAGVRALDAHADSRLPAALLRSAIAATRDPVLCVGPDQRIALYNPAAEQLFGFAEAEVLGRPVDVLLPHIQAELPEPVGSSAAMGSREHTLTAVRKDGPGFRAAARIAPALETEPAYLILVLRAPTEERRAFAELSLLKTMALAIGASEDLSSALELTLQQICSFTGWTAGESWLPDPAHQVLRSGPVWSRADARLEAFHRASEPMTFRPALGLPGQAWASGSAVWIEDVTRDTDFVRQALARECGLHTGWAIPVLAGERVVAVIVFYHTEARAQDASLAELVAAVAAQLGSLIQRKQAEDQLQRRAEELARSNLELEQFAYVASHDLQEPLRMVASYAQLLERRYGDSLDDDAREFIGYVVEGVMRMKQLILDLLAFSRVKMRGETFEPVDLDAVLQRVVQDFASLEAGAGSTITADPLPRLRVDPRQIAQLFQNLIGNALTFRRQEPPRIHVSADRRGDEWVFACRDNGIGIEAEYFERIFVVFQRLHPRSDYPGNGIGLSICKKIVEQHGGSIWVESQPGQGSTFYFTLPADTAADEAMLGLLQ